MNPSFQRLLKHPVALFATAWAALLAVLFAPLLAGGVIVNRLSDGKDGYATRHFAALVLQKWHEIPRWDPYIFGGLPFLGAMHGDQAYPISIVLRAIFPPALGIGLGMVLHLWLAAVGMLVFLRLLRHEWSSAVVGATAYGLSGSLIGLLYPGHDGKIFVLGLLPWALSAILQAARTARPQFFAAWGFLLGLMLLSPHFQMAYYSSLLLSAFLLFTLLTETPRDLRWRVIAGMALGSAGGLLFAGAQLWPFVEYLPFSPRSAAGSVSTGWDYATSYSMHLGELVGAFWGGFNGWLYTYWGPNGIKLNSEYVGLLTGVLAFTAIWRHPAGPERRAVWFWAAAVIVGTLWALGADTPFYHLPYALLPGISKTRAPGMMWGQVTCALCVLVAMGFARIRAMADDARKRWAMHAGIITGGVAVLLTAAAGGLLPGFAGPEARGVALAAVPAAQWGLVLGALTVVAFAVVAARTPRWLPLAALALLAIDLGIQDHRFIAIDPKGDAAFAPDAVVQALQRDAAGTTQPWRVLPLRAYMDDYLIEHGIRSVLGYHGNEIHRYDELLGGKNVWNRLGYPPLWQLLAVRYLLTNRPIDVPGFARVAGPAVTWLGDTAWAWRVPNPSPWAWVVPLALKVPDDQIDPTVLSPGFDAGRIVLVPTDATFGTTTIPPLLPPAITPPVPITVTERQPGVYVLTIDSLRNDAVLVVSENWLPTWTARVDGKPAPIARADGTFIGVPVPAHSREVILEIQSRAERRGRYASLAGFAGLVLLGLAGIRRKPTPPAAKAA